MLLIVITIYDKSNIEQFTLKIFAEGEVEGGYYYLIEQHYEGGLIIITNYTSERKLTLQDIKISDESVFVYRDTKPRYLLSWILPDEHK